LGWSIAAVALLSPVSGALAEAPAVDFLVLGDWGRQGRPEQQLVAAALLREARTRPPRFIISTGDNFYPSGVSSASDPQWKQSFEDVYRAPASDIPWYVILGNHDHKGDINAEIAYGRRNPHWVLPDPYYRRIESVGGDTEVEFFFLDTTEIASPRSTFWKSILGESQSDEQIRWLESRLQASTAEWKIVVGHHAIASSGPHLPTIELVERVKPILKKYGVQAYFNGHDHNLQHHFDDRVHYFTSGSGSETHKVTRKCSDGFCSASLGFMRVHLTDREMDVEMVGTAGEIIHTVTLGR